LLSVTINVKLVDSNGNVYSVLTLGQARREEINMKTRRTRRCKYDIEIELRSGRVIWTVFIRLGIGTGEGLS
jgi:hypothetical protein